MVLDGTVMNASVTTVVRDLDTTVRAMQLAIATFALTMASFMLTGAAIGGRPGRRRAFVIGLCIYAVGSFLSAIAPGFTILFIGWSVVEGLGAVLVIPAIAALAAANYQGRDRAIAYGILGGIAGAAAAAGPLIGGWVTTYFSWRWVFAAETIIILVAILPLVRQIGDGARRPAKSRFDLVGVALSALAMGLVVLALVSASSWGLIEPIDPPFAIAGFSPIIPIVMVGLFVGWAFMRWEAHVNAKGRTPLLGTDLLQIPVLRAGLGSTMVMYFIVAGSFFILPLYLQTVLGLDPLGSGLRSLPMSLALFVLALVGSRLSARISPRTLVQAGLTLGVIGVALLMISIGPDLTGPRFTIAMTILGAGLGLAFSQLGNVNLSAADITRSSEVGGLQGTMQNLGMSLGTALHRAGHHVPDPTGQPAGRQPAAHPAGGGYRKRHRRGTGIRRADGRHQRRPAARRGRCRGHRVLRCQAAAAASRPCHRGHRRSRRPVADPTPTERAPHRLSFRSWDSPVRPTRSRSAIPLRARSASTPTAAVRSAACPMNTISLTDANPEGDSHGF